MEKYDKEERLKYLLENKDKFFYLEWEIAEEVAKESLKNYNLKEDYKKEKNIASLTQNPWGWDDFKDFKNSSTQRHIEELLNLDIKILCKKYIDIEEKWYDKDANSSLTLNNIIYKEYKNNHLRHLLQKNETDNSFKYDIINYIIKKRLGDEESLIEQIYKEHENEDGELRGDYEFKIEEIKDEFESERKRWENILSDKYVFIKYIDYTYKYYQQYCYAKLNDIDNIKFYKQKDTWTVEEFILLHLNLSPKKINFHDIRLIKNNTQYLQKENINNLLTKYKDIIILLDSSCNAGKIVRVKGKINVDDKIAKYDEFKREDLIKWSIEKEIELPRQFLEKKSNSELEKANQDLKTTYRQNKQKVINQFLTAILKQFNPRDKNAAWSKIEYILNNKTYDNTVKLSEDSKYSFDLLKYDKSNDTIIWRKKDSQNPNTENKLSKTQFMAKTYNNLTKSL